MIKFAGAVFIILSASYIGFHHAEILRRRLMYLRNIKTSLDMLESEISFSQNILSRVFTRIDGISGTNGLFLKAAEKMSVLGIKKAWCEAVDNTDMCLKERDKEALYIFGEGLGMSDRDNQIKNIKHTKEVINSLINEANDEYEKNAKLYRSAGFLTGLFFAVILY